MRLPAIYPLTIASIAGSVIQVSAKIPENNGKDPQKKKCPDDRRRRMRYPEPVMSSYQGNEIREIYRKYANEAESKGIKGNNKITGYVRKFIKPSTECAEVPDNAYADGVIADGAVEYLTDYASEKPFFFAVGFKKPHLPFVAPKSMRRANIGGMERPQAGAKSDDRKVNAESYCIAMPFAVFTPCTPLSKPRKRQQRMKAEMDELRKAYGVKMKN